MSWYPRGISGTDQHNLVPVRHLRNDSQSDVTAEKRLSPCWLAAVGSWGICAGAQQDDALTAAGICGAHDAAQVTGVSDPVEGNPAAVLLTGIAFGNAIADGQWRQLQGPSLGDSLEDLTADGDYFNRLNRRVRQEGLDRMC